MFRYIGIVILAIIGISVFTSCSNEPLIGPEQVDIKILGISQEVFDANYGNPIVLDNYEIRVQAFPIQIADEEDFIAATSNQVRLVQPDVILTNGMTLGSLTREGLLMQLDQLLDLEQLDGFVPTILQKVRNDGGDGYLYGLPTTFSSHVLFYNKNLFEQHGVSYPTNGMTWSEVLGLEQMILKSMIHNGEAAYGILEASPTEAASKLDQWIREYALSDEISDLDSTNRRLDIDTERWRSIWQEMIQAYLDYNMIQESSRIELPYEDRSLSFMSQRAPLMLGNDDHWHDWVTTDALSFDWGTVSPPGRTNVYIQNNVIAIMNNSIKQEIAWELVRYITSTIVTDKLLSNRDEASYPEKGLYRKLPVRIKLMEQEDHVDLSAFYSQEPALKGIYSTDDGAAIPADFYNEFRMSRLEHIQTILDGEWSVDDALANLQEKAQMILDHWVK